MSGLPASNGKPVTESAFRTCLLGADVPESAFSKPGAHTWVDLGHISFLYRTKHYKDGSSARSSAGTAGQNPSTGACELLLIARPCQHLYSLGDTGGSLFLDVNNAFLPVDRSILGIDHIDRAVDRDVLPEAGSGLDQ